MITASEAMTEAGLHEGGGTGPIRETWLSADCPGCGREVALTSMTLRENGQQTEYVCSCGAVALIVGPAPGLTGYRIKDNVLSPAIQMWMRQPGARPVIFPAGKPPEAA